MPLETLAASCFVLAGDEGRIAAELQERREQRLSAREQREVARQAVRMKKTEDAYATWTQEVRGRAYVEYRDPPQ